jgi:hypothetical protein
MSDDQLEDIRRRLDEELSTERFETSHLRTDEAATRFFQDLFTRLLNFDTTASPTGQETWQELPVHRWQESARATTGRVFAESGNFRVVYIELEALTRTAERNAVRSLTRSDRGKGWAADGSFLAVFHAPGEDSWHLVTPYEEETDDITTGRPVLRRYTLGEGETHRTVARALRDMDAGRGRLAESISRAFDVEPVTERFYERYKAVFDTLRTELRDDGLGVEESDRYAHITLNRLMFVYYLQKKDWIGGRKDFVRWFHDQYRASDDTETFHETWLSALFFDGMNRPSGEPIRADLPEPVERSLSALACLNGGLFQPTALDTSDVYLSDAALETAIRNFLEEYNFTVTEESPYDIDIAVDPAMLGRIYESLIAEQERDEAGIFYTPRVEVDLMCRLALYEQFREHADSLTAEGNDRIVTFIFSDPRDWDPDRVGGTETLEHILHSLRTVDPACGSGAFLVGMIQVLTELYRKLGETPDYRFKKRIVSENLHGVDIKDWAVRVAEFRLWLALVESEDEIPDQRPVLPNLSFTLKSGDSLVQTLGSGGLPSLSESRTETSDAVYEKLTQLENAKERFFEGEVDSSQITAKQSAVLLSYIDDRIETLDRDATTQRTVGGGDTGESVASAAEAEREIANLERLRDRIESGGVSDFVWELDYPAVMMDGGFDIVIGNPPYVRQEDIADQAMGPERLEQFSGDERTKLQSEYEDALRAFVQDRFDIKPYRTSDLYLYFFFRSLDLLRDSGTLSFVTSNSWLDVDYGIRLQELLLTEGEIQHVLENRSQRTFSEADVNTVISVVNRDPSGYLSNDVDFLAVHEAYSRFISSDTMRAVLSGTDGESAELSFQDQALHVDTGEQWRSVRLSTAALWELGDGTTSPTGEGDSKRLPQGRYRSGKWGKFTRAPTVFFDVVGGTDRDLSRLGQECQVNRGTRTGANQFFYLPSKYYAARPDGDSLVLESTGEWPDEAYSHRLVLPRKYWMHETADGWEPNLILKTSKSVDSTVFGLDSLELGGGLRYLLVIDDPKEALDADTRAYVEWGETYDPSRDNLGRKSSGFPSSVSTRGVDWFDMSAELQRGDILPMKNVDTRHVYWFPEQRAWIDDRLHGIEVPGDEEERRFLAGILNSTYGTLSCEVNGRVNLGRGALDIATDDHERTLVPVLDDVDADIRAEIADAFRTFGERSVTSIFDELGATNSREFSLEDVADDRFELDSLVIQELFGFDLETHRNVYEGTLDLVSQRVTKADSV